MYHQNLGGRRFKNLTRELLYETPRQFSGTFPAPAFPGGTRPSGFRAPSSGSTSSSKSRSPGRSNNGRGSVRRSKTPTPATKIAAAAAAFAEERERERERELEAQQQRGRRKERESTATTVNGGENVMEVEIDELKAEARRVEAGREVEEEAVPIDIGSMGGDVYTNAETAPSSATNGVPKRKSSATLSIVLNELDKVHTGDEETRRRQEEEYVEEMSRRIPNGVYLGNPKISGLDLKSLTIAQIVPYKSVSHPDVEHTRVDPMVNSVVEERALVKPSWRKQPMEKFSKKAQGMKMKFDDQKTSFREKIPFFRNGSTMDRIRETFKFSRFSSKN